MMRYRVRCGQLKNGLRFYTQYDSGSSKELAVIAIKAGAFCDPHNRRGLAHRVEHSIEPHPDVVDLETFDLLLERTAGGPDENRYITTDYAVTTYGVNEALKKHHTRELFHIFSNEIKNPLISRETFISEGAAVNAEHFLRGKNVIVNYLAEKLMCLIFPKTFLACIPIDGVMTEVKQITRNDVLRFITRYYVPANAFVIYFGPKYEQARRIVERELGDWGAGMSARQNRGHNFVLPSQKGGFAPLRESVRRVFQIAGTDQYHIAIGFPTETYMSDDAEALDILARVLSRRMYQRLRVENMEWRGGAYRTPVFTERSYGYGLLATHYAILDRVRALEGIKIFHNECRVLCSELVKRNQIEAHVGRLYEYEFMDWFSKAQSQLMGEVVVAVANGDPDLRKFHARGEKLQSFLRRGGRQKLREVARKYLGGHSATVIFKPNK